MAYCAFNNITCGMLARYQLTRNLGMCFLKYGWPCGHGHGHVGLDPSHGKKIIHKLS